MNSAPTNPPPPSCPRCGYDLSGVIASWAESCPLNGTCSECGLGFEWAAVIGADSIIRHGFFEHAKGWWQRLRWAWVTWAWSLFPLVFWRRVGIECKPRVRAILRWPVFVIIPIFMLVPIIENMAYLIYFTNGLRGWTFVAGAWRVFVPSWTLRFASQENGISSPLVWSTRDVSPIYGPALAVSVVVPVVLLCIPHTRKRAKIRTGHIVRAAIFGFAWVCVPFVMGLPRAGDIAIALGKVGFFGGRPPRSAWVDLPAWFVQRYWVAFFAVIVLWQLTWWACAIAVLFKGHRPGQVMVATLLPACIALAASLALTREVVVLVSTP